MNDITEPDQDDLDFARESLGPDATEDEVHSLAEQRVAVRLEEEGPDMNEGTEFAERHPLQPAEDDEEFEEEIAPYEVPVESLDVSFLTNVEADGPLSLGDAIEIAALNLIRVGLDNYNLLLTDRPSGRQWLSREGRVVALKPLIEEEQGASTDG